MGTLKREKRPLAVEAAGVAGEGAARAQDAMARDNHADGVLAHRTANGAGRGA